MRVLTLSGLTFAALFTAACGGADKPAETTAAQSPAVEAPAAPVAEAAVPTAEAAPVAAPAPPAPAAAAPAAAVTYAALTGDAAKGEKVFAQCKACHVAEAGKNRVGPSLWALVGRTAGMIPGFNYSKANKASGVIWSEDVLFTYLEAPAKFMPGTRMAFGGLKNAQDRADVIAYLKTKA